jgi:uncharacterized repeat protein (TIGR03803 family)
MFCQVFGTITGVIQARGQAGAVAFLILIWPALQCFTALICATNRAWGTTTGNWWRLPLKSLALLGITAGAALLGMAAPVLARIAEGWVFPAHDFRSGMYGAVTFFIPALVLFFSLSSHVVSLVRVTPNSARADSDYSHSMKNGLRKNQNWRGAAAALILSWESLALGQSPIYSNLYALPLAEGLPSANATGANPYGSLVCYDGSFYGTAEAGGTNGSGTIYRLETDGSGPTILHTFAALSASFFGSKADGANPRRGLICASNTLYGTTFEGGNLYGTLFSLKTDGSGFTNLHSPSLVPINPSSPILTIAKDGNNVILTWVGSGYTLESTTNLGNPYSELGTVSPYTNAASVGQEFFRLENTRSTP